MFTGACLVAKERKHSMGKQVARNGKGKPAFANDTLFPEAIFCCYKPFLMKLRTIVSYWVVNKGI